VHTIFLPSGETVCTAHPTELSLRCSSLCLSCKTDVVRANQEIGGPGVLFNLHAIRDRVFAFHGCVRLATVPDADQALAEREGAFRPVEIAELRGDADLAAARVQEADAQGRRRVAS